jgi:PASTA domain
MTVSAMRRRALLAAVCVLVGSGSLAAAAPANAQPAPGPAIAAVTTIFDLNGTYNAFAPGRPIITRVDDILTVNMSAFGRPNASGVVINSDTIVVTFPDDTTYGAKLLLPGTISWSNGSAWSKIPTVSVPNVRGLTATVARQRITAAGLFAFQGNPVPSCPFLGVVAVQTPSAGTQVLQGSGVWFRIGIDPPLGCP